MSKSNFLEFLKNYDIICPNANSVKECLKMLDSDDEEINLVSDIDYVVSFCPYTKKFAGFASLDKNKRPISILQVVEQLKKEEQND